MKTKHIPLETVFGDGVDGTMIDNYQRCKRLYFNRMVRGLDHVEPSVAIQFGKSVHTVLESYYRGECDESRALDLWRESYQDKETDERRSTERGIALLKEYFRVYPKETEPWEVLEVETPFKLDIGATVPLCGRRDLVVRDTLDGTVWVVDHKTTTQWGDFQEEKYAIHTALDGYILGVMEKFGRCDGGIINVLVTSKTKPRIERLKVLRTKEQLEYWKRTTVGVIDEMVRHTTLWYPKGGDESGIDLGWPLSRGRCTDFNSKCAFHDLCRYCDNPDVAKGDFVVRAWTPFNIEG